jgi:16S rRNA (cytidine1402-2'-O)-methyltransferase
MIFDYQAFGEGQKIESLKPGLHVVSTPIGNIEDITIRAIKILRSVDYIICEHHEVTKKLLKYYDIKANLLHYNDDMPPMYLEKIYDIMNLQKSVALVSDAGTPLISDPGYKIIKYAVCRDNNLYSIPGSSSFVAALTMSGFGCSNFYFHGFLPRAEAKSKLILSKLVNIQSLLIFFESPHRLLKTLDLLKLFFGVNAKISVSKEITKFFEENFRGTIDEVLQILKSKDVIKGEYVIILDNADGVECYEDLSESIAEFIGEMLNENKSTKDIVQQIYAKYPGCQNDDRFSKSNLYKLIVEMKTKEE